MPIVEVDAASPLLDTVYEEILQPAFPADELGSFEGLRHGVRAKETSIFATLDDRGAALAAAVAEWSPATGVVLLAYLAVRPGTRAGGLGGALLQHATQEWQARWRPCLTLAEIEHPAAHASTPSYGDPVKRLRFYARQGVSALDLPYFQPALGPGYHRVFGLLLCVLGLSPDCRGERPATVDGGRLRRYLTEYFTHTEGGVGSDPDVVALFAALERTGGVPMLPLDDAAILPCSRPLIDQ